MWRTWSALSACLRSGRSEGSRGDALTRKRTRWGGTALGEAAQQNDIPSEADLRMQPGASTSGRGADSPRASVSASAFVRQPSLESSGRPPSAPSAMAGVNAPGPPTGAEQPQEQQQQQLKLAQPQPATEGPAAAAGALPLAGFPSQKSARLGSAGVRFAAAPECGGHDVMAAVSAQSLPAGAAAGGEATMDRGPSRVRLLLPSDSVASASRISGAGGGGGAEVTAAARRAPVRSQSTASSSSARGDRGSRALSQLAGLLLSQHVDYRAELEELMATHGSAFPTPLLEQWLTRHDVQLPRRRLRALLDMYEVEGEQGEREREKVKSGDGSGNSDGGGGRGGSGGGRLVGVALLKDLDRVAFRHLALGALAGGAGAGGGGGLAGSFGVGGGGGNGASAGGGGMGAPTAATSRKSLMPTAQLGDKTRILQLVAARLAEDETLRIRAGGGEDLSPEHLQEVVEQIDLTSVAVPVGTRAPYVPSTDDPESFHVPVWSLRAMQMRKQERDRPLTGSDPALRQLGQAGREALRKRITRRSIFQQQEIIANAVVTAARAAVAPAIRLAENSIQLGGPSRSGSLQRASSRNSSPLRRSATSIPASAATANAATGSAAAAATVAVAAAAAAAAAALAELDGGGGNGGGGGVSVGRQSPDELGEPRVRLEEEEEYIGRLRPGFVNRTASGNGDGNSSNPPAAAVARQTSTLASPGDVATVGAAGSRCASPSPSALRLGRASPTAGSDAGVGGGSFGGVGGSNSPLAARSTAASRSGTGNGDDAGGGGASPSRSSAAQTAAAAAPPSLSLLGAASRRALGTTDGGTVILPVKVVPPSPGSSLASPSALLAQEASLQLAGDWLPSPTGATAVAAGATEACGSKDEEDFWRLLGGGGGGDGDGGGCDEVTRVLGGGDGGGDDSSEGQGNGGGGGGGRGRGNGSERARTPSAGAEGLLTRGTRESESVAGRYENGAAGDANPDSDGAATAVADGQKRLLLPRRVDGGEAQRLSEAGPPRSPEQAARQRLMAKAVSSSLNQPSYNGTSLRPHPPGSHMSAPDFDDATTDGDALAPSFQGTELPGQCISSDLTVSDVRPTTPVAAASRS